MDTTNRHILISAAGRRVELLKAFQAEASRNNYVTRILATDIQPALSPACREADKALEVLPISHPEYMQQLLQLCIKEQVGIVIPTIDTELQLLADHKTVFAQHGIQIIVSDANLIKQCRDKRLTNTLFTQLGIDVPKQYSSTDYELPLFIKPYNGSLSVDTYAIHKATDLTPYHLNSHHLMFMEYIDPKAYNEYTIDMYYGKDHRLKMAVPRLRMSVRAGEINKGKTVKGDLLHQLIDKMQVLEGAIGCLTVQVFYNPKKQHIIGIEINPRFGGGYPLSYTAGANYPMMLMNEYWDNQSLSYSDAWEDNLLMLRYDEAIYVHEH